MTTFKRKDYVRKKSGAFWEGAVVGGYSTKQTEDGVAVQLLGWPDGPVQIYPAAALEAIDQNAGALARVRNEALEEMALVCDGIAADAKRDSDGGPGPMAVQVTAEMIAMFIRERKVEE